MPDRIPLEVGTFELIISHGSLHRWRDQAAGLAHVHRLLRSGGLLYLSDVRGDLPAELVAELAERMGEERDRQFSRGQVAMAPSIERLREPSPAPSDDIFTSRSCLVSSCRGKT